MLYKQKKIIVIYLVCVIIACVYVPWEAVAGENIRMPAGYALISNPPIFFTFYTENKKLNTKNPYIEDVPQANKRYITNVDINRLLIEIVIITATLGIAYIQTIKNDES
jgi:hypothetical protein